MSYESPITLITGQITSELVQGVDGEIFKAVQKVGVMVDQVELVRALAYDRGQYEKGYADRDAEIVRCKDCENKECRGRENRIVCGITGESHQPDWFCKDGERSVK